MVQKKYFASALAVMMAVTMTPATAFAADPQEVTITNAQELAAAIKNQQAGQTWKIQAGTYTLTQELLDEYSDHQEGGQGNWYFPIYQDGVTIIGEGDVVITSDVETENGVWASQDFISVWADDVTIDNVDIRSKETQNKAIEVMGKNFTLKNSEIQKVNEYGSGSIIFNALEDGNIGNATIENVTLYSWISASYSKEGTLNSKDVTIDFTDNGYAGYSDPTYGYGWCPGIFNSKTNVAVNNENLNIIVDGKINLTEQVFSEKLQPNSTVTLTEDVAVDSMIDITTDNTTLDLGGHTITASDSFTSTWANDAHLLQINGAAAVKVMNGKLDTTAANKHALNVYQSSDVVLENLAVDHTESIGGAPVVINASTVSVNGTLDLTVGTNSWYGINIDPKDGTAALTFADGSSVSMTGNDQLPVLKMDGNTDAITVSGAENAGLDADENGNYFPHEHVFGTEWKFDENGHWKECSCGETSDFAAHTYKWVIDKEATATEKGSKHQECTVCGYSLKAVEIPATGKDTSADKNTATDKNTAGSKAEGSNAPKTGDNSSALWMMVLLAGSCAVFGTLGYRRKQR